MKRSDSTASNMSELNDFEETAEGRKEYKVSTSRVSRLINWMSVGRMYLPILGFLAVGVLVVQISTILYANRFDFKNLMSTDVLELQKGLALDLGWKTMSLFAAVIWWLFHRENPVYMLDFSTFEPPDEWKLSQEQILEIMKRENVFTNKSLEFLERMLGQSGVGPSTAWPPGIIKVLSGEGKRKPGEKIDVTRDFSVEAARHESEVVMFSCVRDVLKRTGVKPKDIDFLVINCSLFSPTPSLCSMVANEFGMRADLSSYNLSGMGCSAGVISIELVKNLLAARPNSRALVISTENLTQNLYTGNERSFLLQNTLFRVGGAAVLLSNRWTDGFRAQMKLQHVVRTQYISEDSYECVYETEDAEHKRGVRLSKELLKVAGRALEKNLTQVGPLILPVSEQLKVARSIVGNMIGKTCNKWFGSKFEKQKVYMPDFKKGVDHFCIHAGGRGVIDSVEKNLMLEEHHVAASRHALREYGNTSSSSIWYEMDFVRRNRDFPLTRGQKVLQVAFGSGFKCNSAVWLCINNRPLLSKAAASASADDKINKSE